MIHLFELDAAGERFHGGLSPATLAHWVARYLHPALRCPLLVASAELQWLPVALQSTLPTHTAALPLQHVLAQLSPTSIDQPLSALLLVVLLQKCVAAAAPASTLFAASLLQNAPLMLALLPLDSALSAAAEAAACCSTATSAVRLASDACCTTDACCTAT